MNSANHDHVLFVLNLLFSIDFLLSSWGSGCYGAMVTEQPGGKNLFRLSEGVHGKSKERSDLHGQEQPSDDDVDQVRGHEGVQDGANDAILGRHAGFHAFKLVCPPLPARQTTERLDDPGAVGLDNGNDDPSQDVVLVDVLGVLDAGHEFLGIVETFHEVERDLGGLFRGQAVEQVTGAVEHEVPQHGGDEKSKGIVCEGAQDGLAAEGGNKQTSGEAHEHGGDITSLEDKLETYYIL